MLRACLVVAAARASQLNVQEAAVIVRGRAVSILSSKGCFTVAGSPCKVLRNGGDDDALSMPAALPSVEVAAPPMRVDAALDVDLFMGSSLGDKVEQNPHQKPASPPAVPVGRASIVTNKTE